MSRIGRLPVDVPENVDIDFDESEVTVSGPLGQMSKDIHSSLELKKDEDQLKVLITADEKKETRALQGMMRSLIDSMIEGVTEGFTRELEMKGVGYRASLQGDKLQLEVGYSHPVTVEAPGNIEFEVEDSTEIKVKGTDKQLVGDVAARIRSVREPEPYKGKGIRYKGENIRRKEGKTAAATAEQ